MGMAASQARYLALVARKSNCEFEGQQINQARLVLSNQTANLFNQMLGLSVPVPPSTQDYTKTQYSFSTGSSEAVIDKWDQLANPEPNYNYVVSYHYYNDVFTGSQKRLEDPQVQFDSSKTMDLSKLLELVRTITNQKTNLTELETKKTELEKDKAALEIQQATLSNYATKLDATGTTEYDEDSDTYTVNGESYVGYNNLVDKTAADAIIEQLKEHNLISKSYDLNNIYFGNGTIVFKSDLEKLRLTSSTTLPTYSDIDTKYNGYQADIDSLAAQITAKEDEITTAKKELKETETEYENGYGHPTYVGNCELELLEYPDLNQEAELLQIWKDLKEVAPDSSFYTCFDGDGNYTGGIYTFRMAGVDYYTTLADLEAAYLSGTGINNIDGQDKLYYYNASMISTRFEKKEKALLETDSSGRFSSVRFEDDTIAYTLNFEQVTDDVAYKDAMNQFNYENALYAKMVQDINAKTSIIQQEDRTLELRLKQLDTEQNALSQEMEAVQKVVKDNVEKSFKTFGG